MEGIGEPWCAIVLTFGMQVWKLEVNLEFILFLGKNYNHI